MKINTTYTLDAKDVEKAIIAYIRQHTGTEIDASKLYYNIKSASYDGYEAEPAKLLGVSFTV